MNTYDIIIYTHEIICSFNTKIAKCVTTIIGIKVIMTRIVVWAHIFYILN